MCIPASSQLVVIVLELEVLHSEVSYRIGRPVNVKIPILEEDNKALHENLSQRNTDIAELREQIRDLAHSLTDEMNKEKQNFVEALRVEKESRADECMKLQEKITAMNADTATLTNKYVQALADANNLKLNLAALGEASNAMKNDLESSSAAATTLTLVCQSIDTNLNTAQNEKGRLQQANEDLNSELKSKVNEHERHCHQTTAKLLELSRENGTLADENLKLRQELQNLHSELESKVKKFERHCEQTNGKLLELSREGGTLSDENFKLRADLRNIIRQRENVDHRNAQAEQISYQKPRRSVHLEGNTSPLK
jgi:DNA repair exonuclease SbcCD ATPase subunit